MRRPALASLAALVVASVLLGAPAAAQEVDEGTRASARQLGEEAGDAYAKGDFASALDKYQRADALVHVPTLSLRVARCLERLGRFLEAAELYLAVTHMEVSHDPRGVQAEAKAQAEADRAGLLPRIPALVIEVAGGAVDVAVTLDGRPVPAALLGARRLVDPGSHRVAATRGATSAEREVVAKAGETVPVTLELTAVAAQPEQSVAPPPPTPLPVAPPPPVAPPETPTTSGPSPRRLAAYALGGVGVAGLAVGAVTGGLVFAQKGAISAGCVAKGASFQCDATGKSAADRANGFALASTVTLPVGLGAAVVGAILFATDKRPAPPSTGALTPFASAGARGLVLGVGGAL
jgi:hypothetical protein